MNDAERWIETLQLQPHPEGGWFRDIYRSKETIARRCLPDRFGGDRAFATAIYFLITETAFSALHRIKQDEVWHFYAGSPVVLHQIDAAGEYAVTRLGTDAGAGEAPLAVIEAGCLFGATVAGASAYSLVGCTVAPGFDYDDFEMPTRDHLLSQYPKHADIIRKLTRAPA